MPQDRDADAPDPNDPTQPAPNLSTRHQDAGDAKRPGDRLNRDQPPPEDDGERRSSLTK